MEHTKEEEKEEYIDEQEEDIDEQEEEEEEDIDEEEDIFDEPMIEEVLVQMNELADEVMKHDGTVQICEDLLRSVAHGSESTAALLHYDIVKTLWGDLHFIGALLKIRDCPSMSRYVLIAKRKLSEFLLKKIRSDPSFEDIMRLYEEDKATMMRDALSVLIGYWSNTDMIALFCSMGGTSLLTSAKGDDTLDQAKETSESSTLPQATIEELRQDSCIKDLADQLLKNPRAVELVEKFMVSLDVPAGNVSPSDQPAILYAAARNCWCYPPFIIELIKTLKQCTAFINIFKKYSKEAQLLRCVARMTRIQKDPLLNSILESDCPRQKTRGALSILFGYWTDPELHELFRLFCIAKVRLDKDDIIQVFQYIADHPDDVKGLKNVLADKYSKDSDEFRDLFDKIKKSKAIEEQAKKIRMSAKTRKYDLEGPALVTVLVKNRRVVMCEVRTL